MLIRVIASVGAEEMSKALQEVGLGHTIFTVEGWDPQYGREAGVAADVVLNAEQTADIPLVVRIRKALVKMLRANDQATALLITGQYEALLHTTIPAEYAGKLDPEEGFTEVLNFSKCPDCGYRHPAPPKAAMADFDEDALQTKLQDILRSAGRSGRREDN